MYKLSAVFILAVACVTFSGLSSNRQEPAVTSYLPSGAMQEKARNACTSSCHDSGIIAQQRLSKEAWTKEVDKMVRWGSELDPRDHDALIDYLSSSFPPDKPAEHFVRAGRAAREK